jgi:hypothetical protein
MFVRWQTYRTQAHGWLRKNRESTGAGSRLKAILVESHRVGGKPRQKHIAFLGAIAFEHHRDGSEAPWTGIVRQRFRFDVTRRLDKLSNRVTPDERQRIEVAIVARTGLNLMTADEMGQYRRYLSEKYGIET